MTKSLEPIQQAYRDWTQTSQELMGPAREYLPGGDTRTTAHYLPYPAFMKRGEGCCLYDVDGHEYVDFMNNFTTLILGHAHPKVVAAVTQQVQLGTAFAAPTESQVELSRTICERVASLEAAVGQPVMPISSVVGQGLAELLSRAAALSRDEAAPPGR